MTGSLLMTRRALLAGLGLLALAAALPSLPTAGLAAERPEEIVAAIYATYKGDGNGPSDPPYSADVAGALAGENHPGFDFFIDAQDFDGVSAEVAVVSESDADAVVRAEVVNFGETKTVEIVFLKDGGAWKIANVRYPVENGFDLRQSLGLAPL